MKTTKIIFTALLFSLIAINVSAQKKSSQQRINIKDMFLLLPDDATPEPLTKTQRQELLNTKKVKNHWIVLDQCDIRNGYLSLGGAQYGWEMCYWNLKDGRKLLAVNNAGESGSIIRIFFWKNGALTEDTAYKLGGEQKYTLENFVDISKLGKKEQAQAKQKFATGDYIVYYKLPQKGTSITIVLDTFSFFDFVEEAPESKEFVVKWVNEKWVR